MPKDRSRNPEVKHMDHLLTALEGGKVPNLEPIHVVPPKNMVSNNYWCPERGIDLVLGRRVKQTERDFLKAYEACKAHSLPQGRAWGWMGSEGGSRSYGGLHGAGWLLASVYGTDATRIAADVWLRFAVAMCKASEAPGGRVLLCGQRSAQRAQPVWWDGLLEAAKGGDPEKWRKAGNWGIPQRESKDAEARTRAGDWFVLQRFAEHVADIAAPIAHDLELAFETINGTPFAIQTVYYWLHRDDGSLAAAWTDRTVNGNTAPMLAGIADPAATGDPDWLPAHGGKHVRGEDDGNDQATCELVDGSLVYKARVNDDATVKLPPGPVTLRTSRGDAPQRMMLT